MKTLLGSIRREVEAAEVLGRSITIKVTESAIPESIVALENELLVHPDDAKALVAEQWRFVSVEEMDSFCTSSAYPLLQTVCGRPVEYA